MNARASTLPQFARMRTQQQRQYGCTATVRTQSSNNCHARTTVRSRRGARSNPQRGGKATARTATPTQRTTLRPPKRNPRHRANPTAPKPRDVICRRCYQSNTEAAKFLRRGTCYHTRELQLLDRSIERNFIPHGLVALLHATRPCSPMRGMLGLCLRLLAG